MREDLWTMIALALVQNIAHFIAGLITHDDTWRRWRGQMPVIYNKDFS